MRKMKKILVLLLVISMIFAVTACKGSDSSDTSLGDITSDPSAEKPLLDARQLENPVVTIMSHYSLWQRFKDSFEENYGGEIVEILVPVTDYMTKTSSMLMSGESLDGIVRASDDPIHFVSFISRGLLQPFDQYIDLDEPIYDHLREYNEKAKWNGKYYLNGNAVEVNEMVLYNSKLFEQVGLDTPWELYQRDEWTWDTMKEAAEMLAQDTTQDGEIDIYGITFAAPQLLIGTTGKYIGEITGNDILLNLKDNDISRALQYTRDLIYNNNFSLNQPTGWAMAFSRERLAMAVVPVWVIQTPEVRTVMEAGNLGVAPVPRDPQNDKYTSNAGFGGWILAKDAENPEGLVAFNKCMIYELNYNEKTNEKIKKDREELNITEIMEQYDAIKKNPDCTVDWGRAFLHRYLWEFWGQENPWSTFVESIEPIILAEKDEAIRLNE